MPDLRLSWGDFPGGYGTEVTGPATIETGGVAVSVDYTNDAASATAFALNLASYDDATDNLPSGSQLKLINDGGAPGDTSTTVLTFASSDPLYGDQVSNLSFRLDDIDAGTLGDIDSGAGNPHEDIVNIRAFDAAGNEIPVSITSGTGMDNVSQTLTGTAQGAPTDAAQSALIEIAGPVARVEIDLGNGDVGEQEVFVSDLLFSTTAPAVNDLPTAVDDTAMTDIDTLLTGIDVLANDSDPDGDPLTIVSATAPNGTVTIVPGVGGAPDTLSYLPDAGFVGDDTITYTITDSVSGTDTADVVVTVDTPVLDGIVQGTAGDDTIDLAYTGDPQGDRIDNGDALLPGEAPQDDIVEAGAGDDSISTFLGDDDVRAGDGNDTVETGTGDDIVLGGAGADDINTEDGSDTVDGGIGDDIIDTSGTNPALDAVTFPSVPVDGVAPATGTPDDDRDSVDGGDGNDTITTGDDADTITGGAGDDVIDAGIDDDSVLGGDGADSITDLQGADTIFGEGGDDTIIAGFNTFSDYVGDDGNLPITDGGTTFTSDPNPDDGRDFVDGGTGNDVIQTGDDADTILGGAGLDTIDGGIDDDSIDGGADDDSITGGHGSDTISGGTGNDFIDASSSTLLFDNEPDATEPAGLELNDRDVVLGGDGDDTILGGDDDDSLRGGAGADSIDGGIDEDTIFGDSGADFIDGGDGDDALSGGADDDTVLGGAGNDTIGGDLGNDSIEGNDGDDSIGTNAGDDTITGGDGADTIFGGADQDVIIGATDGDVVDGGSGGVDFDTLDLTSASLAQQALGGRIDVTFTSADREDGFVRFLDAADLETGRMDFTEIENVIPCFTPGTLIATPEGERRVEDLKVGDRVITRDNGIQDIRWTGAKEMSGAQLAANSHLQPVLIRAGALGDNMPERDILVSPQHRMLLNTDHAAMYFEEREVLVAAKHLTYLDGVDIVESSGTTYIHIMFDQHEVVLSDGAWSESFQPGDYSLDGIGQEQRDEILELFPELATQQGVDAYQSARRALKKFEAKLLLGS